MTGCLSVFLLTAYCPCRLPLLPVSVCQVRFERGDGDARRLRGRRFARGLRLVGAWDERAREEGGRFAEESLVARVVLVERGGVERDCAVERAVVRDGRDGERAVVREGVGGLRREVEHGGCVEERLAGGEEPTRHAPALRDDAG